jgi:tetratricopeptide (TPR) repeat protein
MNETEQIIIQLAETYGRNPDEFINIIENLYRTVPSNEKGVLFLGIGIKLFNFSYFQLALISWENAINYFIQNKDRVGESRSYTNLGSVYFSLGDFRKAIEFYEKSLEIAKGIGDRAGESACYTNLGIVYRGLGDFRKAIEYNEKSLKIDKDIGDRAGESKCYTNLANAYCSLGDFKKAIEFHEKSLEIAKGIGDRAWESACYTNLGVAYYSLGDFKKTIKFHEKSLEIAKGIGNRAWESKGYTNLGVAYDNLGDFNKAIEFYEKSLEIAKGIGDRVEESKCYTNLGIVYRGLGDFNKAIEFHEKSLEIAKGIGDRAEESKCYNNLGVAYFHEKSLEIAKGIGDRAVESKCYGSLGFAYEELNDLEKALGFLNKSAEIRERIKQDISLEELRMLFHAQTVPAYDALSFVYMKKNDIERSINTLDYSKNRELTDMLFCAEALRVNPEYGPKFNELIQQKSELKNQIDIYESWKNEITRAKAIFKENEIVEKIKILENKIDVVMRRYNEVSNKIQKFYDKVSGLKPKDYNILSNALNVLEKENNWLVMEYLIMPYKSEIVVFFIDKNGPLPVSEKYDRRELNSLINKYVKAIFASKENFKESGKKMKEISSEFYNVLFPGKIDEHFKKITSKVEDLMIIPHKYQLHMVPWEILFDGEDYFGVKYSISKNFSLDLGISAINKEGSSGESALLVKNPKMDLDWADKEVDEIKEMLKGYCKPIMIEHKNATTKNFRDKIENHLNVLHFSGHGYFAANPGLSGLIFNDNSLTANTLSGLKFKGSPIVSLSACETGITPPVGGDELMGLIRGFITAGSPSIVSTNWRVYDKSACDLMVEFYKNVLDKKPIGMALRDARKCVYDRYNGEILHWGAYTLYGDQFRTINI